MSEIKGQLLGIVLVVSVFGVVSTGLVAAFKTSAEQVATSVSKETEVVTNPASYVENNDLINDADLLRF
jgi:archaellum component FlaG (FlaF/FlaG flagellin family)